MKRSEGIPKYRAISRLLVDRITSGELSEGMRIPSENELIRTYGISSTTSRKVLQELEITGWAKRVKGKGTFVRKPGSVKAPARILSFTKNMIQAGYSPSTRVLYKETVADGYSEVINGRRYSIKGPALKLHRLRFADDIPMMLEVHYISLKFCPGIQEENLSGSLYDIYEKKYRLELKEVEQMLGAVILEQGVRHFFNVSEPIPGIIVDSVTFCGKELILEMEKSVYRGDKYRFAVRADSPAI